MNKFVYYLFKWHPFRWRTIMVYEMFSLILFYAMVPMLAYELNPYNWQILRLILLSILTLLSGYFATLIWNDISDQEIDRIAHPDRTIPSGRITPRQFFIVALFFSMVVFISAVLISVWCLFVVGMAALFVTFHNKYLKKIVKIPAYSEIFTDRESELEERAQEKRSARILASLDDRTLRAVQEIDPALQRLVDGKYGICERCGKRIRIARLRALPATRFCKHCAASLESQRLVSREESVIRAKAYLPADLSLLDDRELAGVIAEDLREDERIDTEELRIVCRKGVVHLTGAIPSEVERQILLQIVTDVLGLKEVVDRLQVEEIPWEKEGRSKEKTPEAVLPWQEPYGTEDIVESSPRVAPSGFSSTSTRTGG